MSSMPTAEPTTFPAVVAVRLPLGIMRLLTENAETIAGKFDENARKRGWVLGLLAGHIKTWMDSTHENCARCPDLREYEAIYYLTDRASASLAAAKVLAKYCGVPFYVVPCASHVFDDDFQTAFNLLCRRWTKRSSKACTLTVYWLEHAAK